MQLHEDGEVRKRSFVEARDLEIGNDLQPTNNMGQAVRLTKAEPVKEPFEVFNLTVDSTHTHFVSDQKVLVHNTKIAEPGLTSQLGSDESEEAW